MKKLVLGALWAGLLVGGFAGADDTDRDAEESRVKWSCAANNVKGTGPYWGYGVTEEEARVQALRVCGQSSVFRCWPVPDSCSIVEPD